MMPISSSVLAAVGIPDVTADEAYSLMVTQLEKFISLVKTLSPEDWSKPTACTLWNVRDILAHQAGGYASGKGYWEMIRQYARIPKAGQLPEDAVNELQLRERANCSPDQLITELEQVGPAAVRNWAYGFHLMKAVAIPHAVAGTLSLRYLMWVIHSRDTWMHRLDICRATGRTFEPSAGQDRRLVALIVRDVERSLRNKLGGKSLVFDLSGFAGGAWQVGPGEPTAVIRMDALDFSIFASGRFSFEEACARAELSGDLELANCALRNILILF
jgi:uncharacterized protein (TIGR03083 family)